MTIDLKITLLQVSTGLMKPGDVLRVLMQVAIASLATYLMQILDKAIAPLIHVDADLGATLEMTQQTHVVLIKHKPVRLIVAYQINTPQMVRSK